MDRNEEDPQFFGETGSVPDDDRTIISEKSSSSPTMMINNVGNKSSGENFCIEKIFCYELKNFLYIIGSSSCKTKHRILKIDRRNKYDLEIETNKDKVFTTPELISYRRLEGFDQSKRIEPTVAFGIAGFVRFLEGYYLILIIKRRCIALVAMHCIYKIEDTVMIYIPNADKTNSDEQKCLKIFNNVDLKSNFYFSYSYDLSNTLQYNLTPLCKCDAKNFQFGFGTNQTIWDLNEEFRRNRSCTLVEDETIYIKPNMKYVWNEHLLAPMKKIHNDFYLYVCQGFVSQAMLPIDGKNLIITLIARRSKKYAGTRYLKRGTNCDGNTANEVETEQIIHDGNISSFQYGLLSSFVQLRGSVPIYWSQNITKMTPKPPINIDINDPFYEAAGKHFNNLLYNYGSPIIVLNLVKRKEKRPQESILFNELENSIEYLNQFLPKHHHIMLVGYDMAKSKKQDDNVISCLTSIAQYALKKTGLFQNRLIALNQNLSKDLGKHPQIDPDTGSMVQTGLVRVNCVDCLDRTNTAQCVIGMVALAHQLYTMGVLHKPELDPDTEIVRLLEELYEDHGDTLALQYGGSQLVHRIKTYRKGAPITSQSKDIMQSLSRYYSNAFEDWDKQIAINLFLGVYESSQNLSSIWNMNRDYELHHDFFGKSFEWPKSPPSVLMSDSIQSQLPIMQQRTRFTKWWSDQVALCLPRAAKEFFKYTKDGMSSRDLAFIKHIPNYDWFFDVHRLHENTVFVETFLFNMKKSKQSYGDFKKKLFTYRVKNRQSLVGIPIKIRSQDDSESSDESDAEQSDKIIIRFENDFHSFQLDQVEEGKHFDYKNNKMLAKDQTPIYWKMNNHQKCAQDDNDDDHHHHQPHQTNEQYLSQQGLLNNNRHEYEKFLKRTGLDGSPIMVHGNTINNRISNKNIHQTVQYRLYTSYLNYQNEFQQSFMKNSNQIINRYLPQPRKSPAEDDRIINKKRSDQTFRNHPKLNPDSMINEKVLPSKTSSSLLSMMDNSQKTFMENVNVNNVENFNSFNTIKFYEKYFYNKFCYF